MRWSVPWNYSEVVNTVFLVVSVLVVGAIPIIYLIKANLRDPLARAILAGTGASAFAFTATLVALIAYHAGFNPPVSVWNWITRFTYVAVSFGEFVFLLALLRVIRNSRGRDGDSR